MLASVQVLAELSKESLQFLCYVTEPYSHDLLCTKGIYVHVRVTVLTDCITMQVFAQYRWWAGYSGKMIVHTYTTQPIEIDEGFGTT